MKKAIALLLAAALLLTLTACHGSREKKVFTIPETFDESRNYEITFWAKNDTNMTQVEIYKPAIDTRYSEADVVSHEGHAIASTPIDSSASILLFTSEIDVVGIDEAQFFDNGLIDVCRQLADSGIRVIVAGLDMDFRGQPFGPMPGLCAIADEVSKVHAICVKCGQLANFSHRTVKIDKQVLLGETAEYEPLCRTCYLKATAADHPQP